MSAITFSCNLECRVPRSRTCRCSLLIERQLIKTFAPSKRPMVQELQGLTQRSSKSGCSRRLTTYPREHRHDLKFQRVKAKGGST